MSNPTDNTQPDHIVDVHDMVTDTNQASEYQGNEPTYRVDKEKGKYVIRKFVRFDHSWAEYSPPIAAYESEAEAEVAVEALYRKESSDDKDS